MKLWRLLRLGLGEAGASPWRAWPLAAGLALGVACLVFLLGLAAQSEVLIRERVLGSLPDRVRVQMSAFTMGPVALSNQMGPETIAKLEAIPGVVEVFRQARFPEPCQLFAEYGGQRLVTDLVLEGVDPGQVAPELAQGRSFEPVGPEEAVPAVVPRAVLDIVNAGISVNTKLPNLSPEAVLGRHFTLRLGTSSFNPGPFIERRCVIVGVSDQIGVGGPAVPLENLREWTAKEPQIHSLTLRVDPPERMGEVVLAVHDLGLKTPGFETAQKISEALVYGRLAVLLFCLSILVVAGVGLSSGLSLQVREESPFIGLYRALGATRSDILVIYLGRAAALGLAGGLVGVVAGCFLGWAVNLMAASWLPQGLLGDQTIFAVSLPALLLGVGFSLGISLASGLWPARAAARLHPAVALRGE